MQRHSARCNCPASVHAARGNAFLSEKVHDGVVFFNALHGVGNLCNVGKFRHPDEIVRSSPPSHGRPSSIAGRWSLCPSVCSLQPPNRSEQEREGNSIGLGCWQLRSYLKTLLAWLHPPSPPRRINGFIAALPDEFNCYSCFIIFAHQITSC